MRYRCTGKKETQVRHIRAIRQVRRHNMEGQEKKKPESNEFTKQFRCSSNKQLYLWLIR